MISVVDHDPSWPHRFDALRATYADVLPAADVPFVSIEHVGSTTVPGHAAKPVIDCDIVVREAQVAAASAVLESLGFHAARRARHPATLGVQGAGPAGRHRTRVLADGSLTLRNHVMVRDALRGNARLRDEYAAMKREVGASADIDEYGQGKTAMVQNPRRGGLTDDERASIDANVVPSHEELPR